jgi:hypothetical protein
MHTDRCTQLKGSLTIRHHHLCKTLKKELLMSGSGKYLMTTYLSFVLSYIKLLKSSFFVSHLTFGSFKSTMTLCSITGECTYVFALKGEDIALANRTSIKVNSKGATHFHSNPKAIRIIHNLYKN